MAFISRRSVASAFIFLILSAHPINAGRANLVDDVVSELAHTSSLVEELQRTLHEDAAEHQVNQSQEYIGEWFASCGQRKADFERRAGELRDYFSSAREDGVLTIRESVQVVLKARSMTKTLSRAEAGGCSWVRDAQVDTSVLRQLVSDTAAKTPCFAASQEALRGAGPAEQGSALQRAIAIYLSGDCKATEVLEGDPERVPAGADRAEQDADEAADEMEEKALSVESSRLDAPAPLTLEDAGLQGSLAQLTGQMGSHRFLFNLFVLFVGLVAFSLLFSLLCGVVATILTAVIGLVFCMIQVVTVALLGVLNLELVDDYGKSWDTSFTTCMDSWAGHFYSRPEDLADTIGGNDELCHCVTDLHGCHR